MIERITDVREETPRRATGVVRVQLVEAGVEGGTSRRVGSERGCNDCSPPGTFARRALRRRQRTEGERRCARENLREARTHDGRVEDDAMPRCDARVRLADRRAGGEESAGAI